MPQRYATRGLTFLYPDNWTIVDGESHGLPRTVTAQSPQGAFWSVDVHPFSVQPDELLQEVLRAMEQEYVDVESTPAEEWIADERSEGRDLLFTCLDFVVVAELRCLRHGHATYLLTYQAEDRDFAELKNVFRAITTSLFREAEGERELA